MILSSLDNLKELMTQYKLDIPVISTYLSITEHNLILKVFKAAELLGTKGVRLSLGKPLDGKHSYWKIREKILKELESLLKYIKPFNNIMETWSDNKQSLSPENNISCQNIFVNQHVSYIPNCS